MESDEELARKLQEEFDREARDFESQSRDDALLAKKIASESHNISDSESEDDTNDNPVIKTSPSGSCLQDSVDLDVIPISNEDSEAKETAIKRPLCKFGADCYRKNPIHLSEFYHPESNNDGDISSEKKPKRSRINEVKTSLGRKPFNQRLDSSNPYRVFLNKIYSIPETQKEGLTLVFPDLLNPKLGKIVESAQLNFMVDLDFVMQFYKSCGVGDTPVLFMYGQMEGNPTDYGSVTCSKVNMPFQYGVHHSKMMMFQYEEGMRVVVHTANLIQDDWVEKTQGFWVSPLFPPLAEGKKSLLEGDSATSFKRDLCDYLLSYKSPDLTRWTQIVKGHDFSACRAFFVGSAPGYHTGESRVKFGHLKCRSLIRKWSKWKARSCSPVIAQCSSIGSLGKDAKSWLTGELGSSLSGSSETTASEVHLVYPSEEDVKNSLQGYGGGSCLPYNSKTHQKQLWLQNHLHCWRSKTRQRNPAMPHIKTYTRLSSNGKEAQFFILTSSNLSKAAWGQLQKQGTQLFIRSYEAGVLLLPKYLTGEDSFPLASEGEGLKLPYDLPLSRYPSGALPWFMDTKKKGTDILGNSYP